MTRVAVSGGFDPIHTGHLAYLEAARGLGDHLVVILNSQEFLWAKKGYYFYTDEERLTILRSLSIVDEVFLWRPPAPGDLSVCGALELLRPHVFAKGGDRRPDGVPIPEASTCEKLGIRIEYGVGGNEKRNSSSWIVDDAFRRYARRGDGRMDS